MPPRYRPHELELYRRCDEVLHYLWDPIGVAGHPATRDEYASYANAVFHLLLDGSNKEVLVQTLVNFQTDAMGLLGTRDRASAAVDALLQWRDWIDERRDCYVDE